MLQFDPRLISFVEKKDNPGRINFVLQLHCVWLKTWRRDLYQAILL